ncbi:MULTISPECIES: TrmH family RNA methyltransferase [unclassified Carboxylicivirga]|uniref:TrmH family RNA methyltransferase n=1 Tax=Carboxylicivirga TaxID=1628153 RepID=UPI003D34E54B
MTETHSKYFFDGRHQCELGEGSDVIIVTDDFSTPENIGSIIRLAANVNASQVMVVGSEGCRQSKVKKTAGAALGHVQVSWLGQEDLRLPEGYDLVALETVEGANDLFATDLPSRMALVLGNEKYGISSRLLAQCKRAVYVPMPGAIKSMNVSHAASVCLFEWLRRQL